MKIPFFLRFKLILISFLFTNQIFGQTVTTNAGNITYNINGSIYITEATLSNSGGSHGDMFDGAFIAEISNGNLSTTNVL